MKLVMISRSIKNTPMKLNGEEDSAPETLANVFLPPSSIRSAPTLFTTTVQTAVADIPTTGLLWSSSAVYVQSKDSNKILYNESEGVNNPDPK